MFILLELNEQKNEEEQKLQLKEEEERTIMTRQFTRYDNFLSVLFLSVCMSIK